VKASDFRPVTDPAILKRLDPAARGKVVQLDLAALGIQHTGPWPDRFTDGGGIAELFFNSRRMPLARWPNTGYTTIKTVLDNGDENRGGTFVCRTDRPARWAEAVKEGLWLDGFWRVPWQPETIRIAAIDTTKRTITHAAPVGGGLGSKYSKTVNGLRAGSGKENWFAVNVLEELDRPGEWCLRFATKTVYFWPPAQLEGADILITDLKEPMVRVRGASGVLFRGITFTGGLGDGVHFEGGEGNLAAGCTFRNLGGTGVIVRGGKKHEVWCCDLHDLGHGGIYVTGGDRKTLENAEHRVINNHIHHVGQVKRTYAPAIKVGAYGWDAVGCLVRNNLIHDLPHAAILYGGNNNILELNEIFRVALDSGDVGAFYTWHDWTSRGNVVRHNLITDSPGANGVYMDDGDSGDTVTGNVFVRMACGPFVGGGHDNIVRGNLSIECAKGIHIDDRGVARGYNLEHARLVGQVKKMNPKQPPWSERYPEMVDILEKHPDWPTGTVIEQNVTARCKKPIHISGKKEHYAFTTIKDNRDQPDAKLPDAAKALDIPVERIGLMIDYFRHSLPKVRRDGRREGDVFDSETDLRRTNEQGRR
ncbi:right-handed parallel beta-helix repeat-containing protein, partial [bacterium]|nr:right-handed parallel beta-helix repeat-containing protein [bacterium]